VRRTPKEQAYVFGLCVEYVHQEEYSQLLRQCLILLALTDGGGGGGGGTTCRNCFSMSPRCRDSCFISTLTHVLRTKGRGSNNRMATSCWKECYDELHSGEMWPACWSFRFQILKSEGSVHCGLLALSHTSQPYKAGVDAVSVIWYKIHRVVLWLDAGKRA
jgi:hypothetical protein